MKKNLHFLVLCLVAFFFFGTLNAQTITYQLRNADFEAPFVPAPGSGSIGTEPPYWHSFGSLTGPQASLAQSSAQISRSSDTRHGSNVGYYSCKINARSIIIAIANGNMTTGRINAGSLTASNPANHNFTDPNDNNFNEPWGSTPDSIRFWAKFTPNSATQYARMSTYIHDNYKFTDTPEGDPNSYNYIVAHAELEWQRGNQGWYQYTIPFDYASYAHLGKLPRYILITFTTNRTPGSGNGSDALYIDDIEMVYSAWLSDLKINGVTIDGFNKTLLTYGGPTLTGVPGEMEFPYQPADFSWTPEVADITSVVVTNVPGPLGDADGGYTSILVTAEDYVTQKEYRIYYFSNLSNDNNITALSYTMDGTTPIPVPGFTSAQTNYPIVITDPEEVRIPQILASSIVLSNESAEIQRIEQPTGVNSRGTVVVRAQNYSLKSYNLMFSKVQSSNAKLNWIKIGGTDVANFDADTLAYSYSITTCTTTIPTITYEKSSVWASVQYTPATLTNRTATIKVIAENNTQRIYTIHFTFTNNNANLLGYRINSTNQNNVFSTTNFNHTYSASLTSIFTLSLSTTSGQQVCSGSTVAFPSPVVWFPDTNKINVTALDGITKQTYGVIVKNTNCYLKQTSGSNIGLKYRYNGVVRNITIPSANNNNDVTINVTIPVTGPNEPCELIEADPQAPVIDTIIYTQPTARAGNSGRVKVVANDGVANKTYIINFTPTISTDATLSSITYNGFPVPGFNSATEFYTLIFPSSVTEIPDIEFTPNFQWLPETNIVYTPATSFSDTTIITVTAENGTAQKIYKIAYEVVAQEKDAYLRDIRYDNISISGFNPTIYEYLVDVPYSAPTPPQIIPFSSSPTALVFSSVQMTTSPYTQRFLVYSEDMTVTKIYKVDFNRVRNTNAALADIKINGVSLQDFNSEEFIYEFELPYTELNAPVVTAVPAFPYAQVVISQIDTVTGTVTINVTAEDDAYTTVYTIDFTRELSPVNTIVSISYEYNGQTYNYPFNENETEVTIMLPVETTGIPSITNIVLADNRADFEMIEQPGETNNLTGTIVVTAEDLTEKTYTVNFDRTLSGSTLLTGIFYNSILLPDFDPNVLTYHIILPFNNSQIPTVTAIANWMNTNVVIEQATSFPGQATVQVTSEDGQFYKNYTIVFQRQGDPHLYALSYNLDGTSIPIPNFSPSTLVYNINLPIATTAVPVLEYLPEDDRCAITYVPQSETNGTSTVKLVTWNQSDSLTYTVNFVVILSTEALLSDLKVNGVTIENFDPNKFNYSIEYEYGTVNLPVVTATATQLDATVDIQGIPQYPGVATVTVTAGNPTYTNTYTVSFRVEAGDNNYLKEITLNGVPYAKFDKDQYFYDVELAFGITDVPVVGATTEDERAGQEITQAGQLGDTAKIRVTAINGDVALYQLRFITTKNDYPYAKNIYIDWEPIEDFNSFIADYTYLLPFNYVGTPSILVEPEDPKATVATPVWSTTMPLQATITVTAENGITQFTYCITFERASNIESYNKEFVIRVFPNPSSDVLHFVIDEMSQQGYLEIYSIENKKVGNYYLHGGNNEVNIEHLSKGIYFYKFFTDKTMLGAGKFIKQ
ncbi:MAG: T9SS type A sorting domain-containing protein [Bacteroidetes bacterium]|nr:T9SS type A sorting domain-containing protein [Bacteroidota bacterium]MCL1968973.1 T9SS type A sorting domain-containing protein [Bacteroidota bacterium]